MGVLQWPGKTPLLLERFRACVEDFLIVFGTEEICRFLIVFATEESHVLCLQRLEMGRPLIAVAEKQTLLLIKLSKQTFLRADQLSTDRLLTSPKCTSPDCWGILGYDSENPREEANTLTFVVQIDLVNENELGSIKRVIRGINSMAKVQQAVKGKVDLDYVLGVGGFDLERWVLWQTTGFRSAGKRCRCLVACIRASTRY